ncbi:MAG TPA: pitrilysin family protein [Herpetosiphonaceae bacterium]|nr:pitrilysin family protein [Herpetosiphonaceae bacterium]
MPHTKIDLPNGLRIVTEEMPHTHSVSMGIFTQVGSRYESARLSGVSHFLEHMFFKGTPRRNAKQISEAIEGVGGMLNAYTSYDSTAYYAKVANIHFDRAVDTLSDMLLHSLFDPKEIEKERRVIIEEINMSLDQPAEWVHQLLDATLWGDQPLGRDIAGTPDTVGGITRDDLLAYKNQHYTYPNTVISLAGNMPSDVMVEAWSRALERYGEGTRHDPEKTLPPEPGPRLVVLNKDTEQANFCLGLPALSFLDPDRRPLQVLNSVLGGGMASRLFQEIREERGLAYAVYSYTAEFDDAGKWVIYGGVEDGKVHDAIEAVLQELRKLRDEGITDEELQHVKEQVKGGMLLGLEDTWSVAARNGSHILRYDEVIPVEQVVAEIEAVTQEDVLRVAGRLIKPEALNLAVIGPNQEEQSFQQLLTI